MDWFAAVPSSFLSLTTAVFCVQCELITENTTAHCLACGSSALLNLSRTLGGSLRGQPTARLIVDSELDQLVHELLRTVPAPRIPGLARPTQPGGLVMPTRHHARAMQPPPHGVHAVEFSSQIDPTTIDLQPAISVIAERAQVLTGATGAAIALRRGDDIVCRARAGRTAPDLGIRMQTSTGISAQCVRTGEIVLCNDADANPEVDLVSCQRLGVRSILAAPIRHFRRTLGIFEVLSSAVNAFDDSDVATMQLLSTLLVAAMTRLSKLGSASPSWNS